MAQRSFGQFQTTLYDRRRRTRNALLIGASLVVIGLAMPARAETIQYSDGEVRTAPLVMTEDSVGDVAVDETATQSGAISGAYKFSKAGFGTLALLGNNSFSGGVDLNMGTLVLGHQNALGTGALAMAGDTRLLFQPVTPFTFGNDVSLAGVSEWGGADVIHNGIISGAGRLLLDGKFNLRGLNTYGGGTELSAGTRVLVGLDETFGTGQVVMGNGSSVTSNIARTIRMNNDFLLNGDATFTALAPYELHGLISGNGRLIKNGTHALHLFAANTYSGGSLLNGAVMLGHDSALGTGLVSMQDGYLGLGGHSVANDFALSGTNNLITGLGSAVLSGDIGESAPGATLWISGVAPLTLTGKSTYTGNTRLTTRLIAAAQDVLSQGSHYALDTGGTIELQQDQAIGGLSGTGAIEMSGNELDLFQGEFNREFGGTITGGGLVRKYGDGRLRLSGNNAAYDGSFIAGGGTLDVTGDYSGTDVLVSQGTLTGSGSVGDVSVSVGTLAGRSGQTLTMASLGMMQSSTISVALGMPGGQPLFHVLGDVRLDGFIDIENAGGFGPGVYRIMDYDGALDYRGLIIDRLPNGVSEDEIELQLAVANQLNIVSTAAASGPTLFWDGGDAALWNNGAIDGGTGVWRTGVRSFTTTDGNNNNTMNPKPGFAIFQGQGGTVTVDNTTGDAQVTGMQFAADGYILEGDAITLEEDESIIRVGDGTSEGADYVTIINNVLNGNGGLIKTDLGTLVLNSDNNHYVRDTEVRGGTLEVNGSIEDVLVGQDGRLQGSGSVGTAEVLGTIAAGSSYPRPDLLAPAPAMGRLLVQGDLILSQTSIFELKVDAEGNNDLIEVDGTAYLDGRLVTLASGGDYADSTEYTFLRAEGGVEGTFDGVTANLAFLDASLIYNDNDVRLTLSRNGVTFGNVGTTANQLATGAAVETLGAGNEVYDRVLTLSAEDARAGFDQLSGEIHASAKAALLSSGQAVAGTMEDRVAAAFAQLGQAGQNTASGLNFWSQASGSIGVLQANGNAAASSFGAGNLFVGADAMFNQNWMFGAMVGYGSTSTTATDRSSTAISDNYHVGFYGGGEAEDFTFKFGAGYTQHDIDTTRSVTMPGFAEQLFSTRSGGTGQVFGEIGHKFAFDSGLVIEPFANLAHASLFTGGFAERGGAAALSGGSSYASTTHLTLGIRGETKLAIGEMDVTAKGMIGWRHALGTVDPTSTHAFSNGAAFTVSGSPVAHDTAIVEAGLDFNISPNVDLGIGYDGQFGAGMQHGIKTNLSVKF